MVISEPEIGLPFAETFRAVTVCANCGFALRLVLRGGTTHSTVEVNDTGPISLKPLTRPPPPPNAGIMARAAYAGLGASQSTTCRTARAKLDVCWRPPIDAAQKLGTPAGGRMTAGTPACWWRIWAFGSETSHTPVRMAGSNVRPLGSVVRSKTSPAGVSLARLGTESFTP